jgi:hypothetical protein
MSNGKILDLGLLPAMEYAQQQLLPCVLLLIRDGAFVCVVAGGLWQFAKALTAAITLREVNVAVLKLFLFLTLTCVIWKILVEVWIRRKSAEYTGDVSTTTSAGLLEAVGFLRTFAEDETSANVSEKRNSDTNLAPPSDASTSKEIVHSALTLDELMDGDVVSLELVTAEPDERFFVCLHPYKTHDVSYFGLVYGGHLLTVNSLDEAHQKSATKHYLFQVHRFGTEGGCTLRSLCSNTFLTSFEHRFSKQAACRVVAWHRERSSKALTFSLDVLNPPSGGQWEQWMFREKTSGEMTSGPLFTLGREKEYWKCLGPDHGISLSKNHDEASRFRVHLVSRSDQRSRLGEIAKDKKGK